MTAQAATRVDRGGAERPVQPAQAAASGGGADSACGGDGPGEGRAAQTSASRLWAVEIIRVVAVLGVISVHSVSNIASPRSTVAGALTIWLHVNREVFIFITACVLCYVYGRRPHWSLTKFWRRRYAFVVAPYVTWSVIYLAMRGIPLTPGNIVHALAYGDAMYHLYFLLVSMQIYLIFPLLLWFVRVTRAHHRLLAAAALAAQLAVTSVEHFGSWPPALDWWLSRPDPWLMSYVGYIILGALAAEHLEDLRAWVRAHARLVVAGLAGTLGLGLVSYSLEMTLGGLGPLGASAVFQPAVTLESIAVMLALYLLGLRWAERATEAGRRRVSVFADASFGVFLAHPLVLTGGLAVADATGLHELARRWPGGVVVPAVLCIAVPLIYAGAYAVTEAFRRTPVSVLMTGRAAMPGGRRWLRGGLARLADRVPSGGVRVAGRVWPLRPASRRPLRRMGGGPARHIGVREQETRS